MSTTTAKGRGTAFITGATSGIGRAYAERFAARGFNLVLAGRSSDRLQDVAIGLQDHFGVNVDTIVGDLSQSSDLEKAVLRLASDASISVLVNSASLNVADAIALSSPESMVALNIVAVSALSMAVLPNFLDLNQGTIINVGAAAGFAPLALKTIYSASKAYVHRFTQGLHIQVEGSEVRVQLVIPAFVTSETLDPLTIAFSAIQPSTFMTTEMFVDAALQGLDDGELITIPSLHNIGLLQEYEVASMKLMAAAQTGQPAKRYMSRS